MSARTHTPAFAPTRPLAARTAWGALAAFVTSVGAGGALAVPMAPWVAARFGEHMRDPSADGLMVPALLGGYAVTTIALVWLYSQLRPQDWAAALRLGAGVGLAVFVGDHLVTAGWSRLDAFAMLVSGGMDSLALVAAMVPLHLVLRNARA